MSITIKATIRPTAIREPEASGDDYAAARAAADAAVLDGWQVLSYRTHKD